MVEVAANPGAFGNFARPGRSSGLELAKSRLPGKGSAGAFYDLRDQWSRKYAAYLLRGVKDLLTRQEICDMELLLVDGCDAGSPLR